MIARVWHGVTRKSQSEQYYEYMVRTGIRDYRAIEGNCGVFILKETREDNVHFLFVSLWESYEAIRRFAGNDIDKARYYPEDKDYLLELEPTVAHYEVSAFPPNLFRIER